jgi:hypothetical protein
MGPDLDLEDDRILGAGEVGEGPATPGTPASLGGQDSVFPESREVRVVASPGPGPAGLLAARSPWGRVRGRGLRGGGSGRGGGLGLAAEELLLAEAELGLESVDLGLELGLAFQGSAMHGLPVGGLAPGLELLLEAGANRTRALRDGGSRAEGGRCRVGRRGRGAESVQFRDRDPEGGKAENGGRPVVHGGRV